MNKLPLEIKLCIIDFLPFWKDRRAYEFAFHVNQHTFPTRESNDLAEKIQILQDYINISHIDERFKIHAHCKVYIPFIKKFFRLTMVIGNETGVQLSLPREIWKDILEVPIWRNGFPFEIISGRVLERIVLRLPCYIPDGHVIDCKKLCLRDVDPANFKDLVSKGHFKSVRELEIDHRSDLETRCAEMVASLPYIEELSVCFVTSEFWLALQKTCTLLCLKKLFVVSRFEEMPILFGPFLPKLEHLSLRRMGHFENLVEIAPNLRRLVLHQLKKGIDVLPLLLLMKKLEYLECPLDVLSAIVYSDLQVDFPCISEINVAWVCPPFHYPVKNIRFTTRRFPHVRKITFNMSFSKEVFHILELPSLEIVETRGYLGNVPTLKNSLENHKLKWLIIKITPFDDRTLAETKLAFPEASIVQRDENRVAFRLKNAL